MILTNTRPMRRLETSLLLRAYAAGLFPMADMREAEDVFWVEPRRRGIIPLEQFHLPRSLARTLRRESFIHSADLAFAAVIRCCAASAEGREQSWINPTILEAYSRLHAEGHAHSIESWDRQGRLVGGLYGVRIGAAFFGESMFSLATDASKAALAHLIARLSAGGFHLLDTQFLTTHLARFGAIEVRRAQYLDLLHAAIDTAADWNALQPTAPPAAGIRASVAMDLSPPLGERAPAVLEPPLVGGFGPSGAAIVQLLTQTS